MEDEEEEIDLLSRLSEDDSAPLKAKPTSFLYFLISDVDEVEESQKGTMTVPVRSMSWANAGRMPEWLISFLDSQ